MNVVYYGMVPIFATAALLVAAVAPFVLASVTRRTIEAAAAFGQRRLVGVPVSRVLTRTTTGWTVPMDVAAANPAWRAPPTVRSRRQPDDPIGFPADRSRR